MVLPVDHILGAVDAPFLHPEEIGSIFVVPCIDIHGSVVDHRSRVAGIACLHKGILGKAHEACCHE